MKKICFIFCHGFGFDSSFWQPLIPWFSGQELVFWDLGYFADESLPIIDTESFDYIGIGHSLGFMKLLSLKIPFQALIGLNGFINFLGFETTLRQQRTREWISLKKHFQRNPIATLTQFYQRVGVTVDLHTKSKINHEKLMQDFVFLATTEKLGLNYPILLLSSAEDSIVPKKIIEDNFLNQSSIILETIGQQQTQTPVPHGLGYLHSDWVFQRIQHHLLRTGRTSNHL
jgi:pimeloyl-[acyl-carrier protein] methyl ester esterase